MSLDAPNDSLAGIVAWYSIIHVPDKHLPAVFAEFHRVVRPGGLVLFAFQVGDEPRRLTEALGHAVDLEFRRRRPDDVAKLLRAAGFGVRAQLVREPERDGSETTQHAYLLVEKAVLLP